MNEEIMSIRGWVQDALKSAVEERNKDGRVSNYDRGRIAGIISAYQHVMIKTSPTAAWKIPKEEVLSSIRILEHDINALEKRLAECKAL